MPNAAVARPSSHRALVTGHFSTVGDIEVLRQVEGMLGALGIAYAVSPLDQDRVGMEPEWVGAATLNPADFTHLIVVCGPYVRDYPAEYPEVLTRFRHCVQIGVNLTMVAPLSEANPFDALLERDSDRMARPDLSFLHQPPRVPVIGLCLARPQREYGSRQRHDMAEERLRKLLRDAGVAVVELDTVLPRASNDLGIGTAAEYESICARLDAVVTTRLHGAVLALKNGVPVLAVDAISGGDKITHQTQVLGWAESYILDRTTDEALADALRRCLDPEARRRAQDCAARARRLLAGYQTEFAEALEAQADVTRRPLMAPRRGRLSQLAARYRKWKRHRFPRPS
ncbi:polysaccharide pyruvyl transferase family protein [Paracoccus pacificus]|uniref:Polysaccharide pyruvyl transferase family protein n=1 Tax=Paracoccus pacificus TaxID=1463598 RepID=A0ABW4R3N0_9RHOB